MLMQAASKGARRGALEDRLAHGFLVVRGEHDADRAARPRAHCAQHAVRHEVKHARRARERVVDRVCAALIAREPALELHVRPVRHIEHTALRAIARAKHKAKNTWQRRVRAPAHQLGAKVELLALRELQVRVHQLQRGLQSR